MKVQTPVKLHQEEALGIEVERALKFLHQQVIRGYTVEEALIQMEGSYGERTTYFVALALIDGTSPTH
jgi:hypothetical protein